MKYIITRRHGDEQCVSAEDYGILLSELCSYKKAMAEMLRWAEAGNIYNSVELYEKIDAIFGSSAWYMKGKNEL